MIIKYAATSKIISFAKGKIMLNYRELKVTGQKWLRKQEGMSQRGLTKALGFRVQIPERRWEQMPL